MMRKMRTKLWAWGLVTILAVESICQMGVLKVQAAESGRNLKKWEEEEEDDDYGEKEEPEEDDGNIVFSRDELEDAFEDEDYEGVDEEDFGRAWYGWTAADGEVYEGYADLDTDHDRKISVDEAKAAKCLFMWTQMEADRLGYFPNLESLACYEIERLDLSKNVNLKKLYGYSCGPWRDGKKEKLDVRNNIKLEELDMGEPNYSGVDLSNNVELKRFEWYECGSEKLNDMDFSNNLKLETVVLGGSETTRIDLGKNTQLKHLTCSYNKLKELDLSKNTELIELHCEGNQLTKLDLSKNVELETLICGASSGNQINGLDLSNLSKLRILECSMNKLKELDLSKNTELTELICDNNVLTRLDISKNTKLTKVNCEKNKLTTLDVRKNKSLKLANLICDDSVNVLFDHAEIYKAYRDLIKKKFSQSTDYHYYTFKLIYIDQDSIPELLIKDGSDGYNFPECGYYLYTFKGGKAKLIPMDKKVDFRNHGGASFCSSYYIPKSGKILCYSGSNYGGEDDVFQIKKGKIKSLASGSWERTSMKKDVRKYKWNGKVVSKKKYDQLLNKQFSKKKRKNFVDIKGVKYSKMISILEKKM